MDNFYEGTAQGLLLGPSIYGRFAGARGLKQASQNRSGLIIFELSDLHFSSRPNFLNHDETQC